MKLDRIRLLFRRTDFRQKPIRAIWRRLWWRIRWKLTKEPWEISLSDGPMVAAGKSGNGALIYFGGSSDEETSSFLKSFLREGMTFLDVGANLGEFSIRGAQLVGSTGEVHAFEPHPEAAKLLERNTAAFPNITVNRIALSDSDGQVGFRITSDSALGSIDKTSVDTVVRALRLDQYWVGQRAVDLIKVDVEGAELAVLRGAEGLNCRPIWLFEYEPENYARYGYAPSDIIEAFRKKQYAIRTWDGLRCRPLIKPPVETDGMGAVNLIAVPIELGW
jgi:FkbM family methyltransferase